MQWERGRARRAREHTGSRERTDAQGLSPWAYSHLCLGGRSHASESQGHRLAWVVVVCPVVAVAVVAAMRGNPVRGNPGASIAIRQLAPSRVSGTLLPPPR